MTSSTVLTKNLMTHFVWYLEKEKRTFLWKNHAENMHQKVVPDPFLMLVNNPKQPLTQEIISKIRYFERGLSKNL